MRTFIEPVSGGLVTARDPSVLQPGELQDCYAVMYLPDTDSLWRQPGSQTWSVVASADKAVEGLTACRFDNDTHLLVAHASGKLWTADAETDASAFSSATVNASGRSAVSRLVSVGYDNRHYLFDGVNQNRVLLTGGTSRQHGLDPALQNLTPLSAVASAFSASATGYYEYWYTELVKFADGQELESTFAGTPLTVYVTSTSTAPVMELPQTARNVGVGTAISYNVYRSEMKATQAESLYPIGRQIRNVAASNTAGGASRPVFTDSTETSNTGTKTAGSNDTSLSNNVTVALAGGASSPSDALSTADAKQITVTRVAGLGPEQAVFLLHNFSLGTFEGNVVGIQVTVDAKASVASVADIYVVPVHRTSTGGACDAIPATGGQPAFSPSIVPSPFNLVPISGSKSSKRQTITHTAAFNTYTFGGTTDDFLPSPYTWKIGDFDSNFAIQLGVLFSDIASGSEVVTLDRLTVTVYYAATSTTKTDRKSYDAIVVEEGGVELKYGANGRPPIASTGCIFEGSLVTDDVANPGRIVWSQPLYPDYFPNDVYWIEPPSTGKLTYLGVARNRLIAATQSSVDSIRYLPNEDDASFSRGRAYERLSDFIGIINPSCACIFKNHQGSQELAFVDTNGVFATDGVDIRKLSGDLQWVGPTATSVIPAGLGGSISSLIISLTNDPRTQTLRLQRSNGSYFAGSYAARHVKGDGGLKWTKCTSIYATGGNNHVPTAVASFRRANGSWITAHAYASGVSGGLVRREDTYVDASFNTLSDSGTQPYVHTRELYLAGVGQEHSTDAVVIHGVDRETGSSSKNIAGVVSVFQYYTNAARNSATQITVPGGVTTCRLAEAGVGSVNCDGYSLKLTPDTTGMFELQGLGLRPTDYEESELRA